MNPIHAELAELASKYYDGLHTDAEFMRLNEILKDRKYHAYYLELSSIHYCMQESLRAGADPELTDTFTRIHQAIIPDLPQAMRSEETQSSPRRLSSRWPLSRLSWQIAASLLVAVTIASIFLTAGLRPNGDNDISLVEAAPTHPEVEIADKQIPIAESSTSNQKYVARIIAIARELAWEPNGAPSDVLMRVLPGERIRMSEGLLKVEFHSGATVILKGPADLEFLSANSARLWYGSVTGNCQANQFTLWTPQAEVIDVGTEFGVAVDRSRDTFVTVFSGEVHVRPSAAGRSPAEPRTHDLHRLTTGMALKIDAQGAIAAYDDGPEWEFEREVHFEHHGTLGKNELSLADVISGSGIGELRPAGAINPTTGEWDQTPWSQPEGVERLRDAEHYAHVLWNPMVDGVFVPSETEALTRINSAGHQVDTSSSSGFAWGPIWARRRMNSDHSGMVTNHDVSNFWGEGTSTALFERLFWARDSLVGLHANVGVTIDLDVIRQTHHRSLEKLRGIVTYLEPSHDSQPFQPNSRADFFVYVDGQERFSRVGFSRRDGDAQFGARITDRDRFLTLMVLDGGDGSLFDRVILIDSALEFE